MRIRGAYPGLAGIWLAVAAPALAAPAPGRPAPTSPRPAASAPGEVALRAQPGTPLDRAARVLVAPDLRDARRGGGAPLVLIGSADLDGPHRPPALFVQLQSADLCGSAGCSTSVYVRDRSGWRKVLDSISGPIRVDRARHRGMHDLIVHGKDRWVWNGHAYADTVPTPPVDLHHSRKRTRDKA
jgi:hypothetical protein